MKNKMKLTLGLIILAFAITGCDGGLGGNNGTNQHDAKTTKIVVDGTIKLQEMEDKKQEKREENATIEKSAQAAAATKMNESNNATTVELKKLDIESRGVVDVNKLEQKRTLDVNEQAEREFELEKMRIQLLEAQKLKNELELEKLKIEEKKKIEKEKARAAAARAKAKRDAEKEEMELLKMLSE